MQPNKNLHLSLKSQWFEMTKQGVKTEDYREINEYWFKRLVYCWQDVLLGHNYRQLTDENIRFIVEKGWFGFNDFSENVMTLGYPKKTDTERILRLEHKGIEIRTGNKEWGAEEGKNYFVIKHGNILK
jgi:hypothetical protein